MFTPLSDDDAHNHIVTLADTGWHYAREPVRLRAFGTPKIQHTRNSRVPTIVIERGYCSIMMTCRDIRPHEGFYVPT